MVNSRTNFVRIDIPLALDDELADEEVMEESGEFPNNDGLQSEGGGETQSATTFAVLEDGSAAIFIQIL